ncbi:MAG: hypothetical protein LC775_02325 [Acidobacteria bacterium]|nr:hypothetical protein [Acidobacteriota bacterium]
MLALNVEWDVLHNTLGAKKLALYSVGAGARLLLVLSPFERLLCVKNENEESWRFVCSSWWAY